MPSSRPRLIALLIATSLLTGCAPVVSKTDTSACPPLVTYTPGQQQQAAAEIEALPATSILPRFMADYAAERAQLRACQP